MISYRTLFSTHLPWIAVSMALFGIPRLASAATIEVAAGVGEGGQSQCSLAEAVEAVNQGHADGDCAVDGVPDRIELPPGTYTVTADLNLTASVDIVGSGRGVTVIEAGVNHAIGVFADSTVALKALTVAAPASQPLDGVYLEAVEFEANDVEITGFAGRGIFSIDAVVNLTDSVLSSNGGPGIDAFGEQVNVYDSVIDDNEGSGISVTSGDLDIHRSIVTRNRDSGIRVTEAVLDMHTCLVDDNQTSGNGGGIFILGQAASFFIYRSTISNNWAQGDGGGLYVGINPNTNMYSSTVSGNRAERGGGLFIEFQHDSAYFEMYDSTVADNHAEIAGGGIYESPQSVGDKRVGLNRLIVADNTRTNPGQQSPAELPSDLDGHFSVYGALVGFLDSSAELTPTGDLPVLEGDAGLGPLVWAGGPLFIKVHPLLPTSLAIDAGDASSSDLPIDNRLFGGPIDGDGDQVALWDYGSFEYYPGYHYTGLWSFTVDFEQTALPWRGNDDTVVELTRAQAFDGEQSLLVTNRTHDDWQGAVFDLTWLAPPHLSYQISAKVRLANGSAEPVYITRYSRCPDEEAKWQRIAEGTASDTDWVHLSGIMSIPECDFEELNFYIEKPSPGVDFYIDDVEVTLVAEQQSLQGSFAVTTDWGSGYCVELQVTNPNGTPTSDWSASFSLPEASIFDIWNLNTTGSSGQVTVTPTEEWNRVIPAGGSTHSLGFCADRSAGSQLPTAPVLTAEY